MGKPLREDGRRRGRQEVVGVDHRAFERPQAEDDHRPGVAVDVPRLALEEGLAFVEFELAEVPEELRFLFRPGAGHEHAERGAIGPVVADRFIAQAHRLVSGGSLARVLEDRAVAFVGQPAVLVTVV